MITMAWKFSPEEGRAQKRRIPLEEGFSATDCKHSVGQVVLALRSANWFPSNGVRSGDPCNHPMMHG